LKTENITGHDVQTALSETQKPAHELTKATPIPSGRGLFFELQTSSHKAFAHPQTGLFVAL